MTMIEKIKQTVKKNQTLFGFEYQGKDGNIDPFYIPGEGQMFLLFFDGEETTVKGLDAVFSTPFIDGQCLNDMAEDIAITQW